MAGALDIKRVLISDSLDKCCKEILEANGAQVDVNTKLSKEELLDQIKEYDGLIVRSATKVTADVIKAGKKLKLIGRAGTGVDNIDTQAASMQGVLVMNTPGGNTLSAAEHTCALMSTLARHIPQASASMKAGKWERKQYMGNELYGKTLAIIGLGRIGREVAIRMQSYGVKTIGYDPLVSAKEAAEFNIQWMELGQIWPLADFITVHVPLIPPTKGMLNDKTLAQCKKGVIILNVARGGIVDEEALLRGLESGHVGGAGLDVYVTEPPTGSSAALVQHPNVVACPHLGASTVEAQLRVAKEIAEQFVDAIKGKALFGIVNVPFDLCDAMNSSSLVSLGQGLGKVAATLAGGDVTIATVTTHGQQLKSKRFLATSVSMGIVNNADANLVNAVALAKSVGLKVTPNHSDDVIQHYPEALTVEAQGKNGTVTVSGSLLGDGIPSLISYDNVAFNCPIPLKNNLLLFKCKANPTSTLLSVLPKLDQSGAKVSGFSVACSSVESMCALSTSIAVDTDKILQGVAGVFAQISF